MVIDGLEDLHNSVKKEKLVAGNGNSGSKEVGVERGECVISYRGSLICV